MEESKANMNEGLDEVIEKWLDGLEWGNEEPEQLELFKQAGADLNKRS